MGSGDNQEGDTEENPLLDLTAPNIPSTPQLPSSIAERRAVKYDMALGEDSPGVSVLQNQLQAPGGISSIEALANVKDKKDKIKTAKELLASQEDIPVEDISAAIDAARNPVNKEGLLEKQFADAVLDKTLTLTGDPESVSDAVQNPASEALFNVYSQRIQKFEAFAKIAEEANAVIDNSSWLGWGGQFAKTLLPGYSWSSQRNDTLGEKLSSRLAGSNKEEQYQILWAMDPEEAIPLAKQIYAEMAASNPIEAQAFFSGLVSGYSSLDSDVESIMGIVDVASAIPGTKALSIARRGFSRITSKEVLARAAKDIIPGDLRSKHLIELKERLKRTADVVTQKDVTIPEVLSGTGYVKEAAKVEAVEMAKRMLPDAGKTMQQGVADLLELTPSLYSPKWFKVEASRVYKDTSRELGDFLNKNRDNFISAFKDPMLVSRLPQDVEQFALDKAEEMFNDYARTSNLNKAVLNVRQYPSGVSGTNIGYVEAILGYKNGSLFPTSQIAENVAKNRYNLPEGSYSVTQEGDKFAIAVRKDIKEVGEDIQSRLITTENASNTGRNKILGFIPSSKMLHSAKDSVSTFQGKQRAVATHAVQVAEEMEKTMISSFEGMSKKELKELENVFAINRDTLKVKGDPSSRGKFYNSVTELEEAFIQNYNKLPTAKQIKSYMSYVQQSDRDYIFKAVNTLKTKARLGAEKMQLRVGGKDISFEGVEHSKLPYESNYDLGVYVTDSTGKSGKFFRMKDPAFAAVYARMQKEGGYKFLQTFSPENPAVREALGESKVINFIATKKFSKGALSLREQVDYNPGGHIQYKSPFFIKQPQFVRDSLGRLTYASDKTLLAVSNSAKGMNEVKLLEEARLALKAKDKTALSNVIAKGLPYSPEELVKMFNPKDGLSLDVPLALVADGKNAAHPTSKYLGIKRLQDAMGDFLDHSNNPYNLEQHVNGEFLGSRDGPLYSIKTGTDSNPIAGLEEAPLIDPIQGANEAMGRIIRDRYFSDYKETAAQSFVEEFGDMLYIGGKSISPAELRQNPAYYLSQGELKGAPTDARYATARTVHEAIKNLVGQAGIVDQAVSHMQQKLAADIFTRFGEGAANKFISGTSYITERGLVGKMRGMAFHLKLGLFNTTQVALQAQTGLAISARSPKYGMNGTLAGSWMMRLRHMDSDEALSTFAEKASKITPGWSKEMFEESYRAMKSTGFDLVSGDASFKNMTSEPKLIQGATSKFLDMGTIFFSGTERWVRTSAWNTAYSEYIGKGLGKVGKMSKDDIQNVLIRAQNLTMDMTRDSHAFWQEGAASLATQFWGYQMRMFDLMTGTRITTAEKTRLVAFNAMMYGVPIGVTPLLPAWPWEDELRTHLKESGYNTDDGVIGLMMNGVLATSLAGLTGDQYDIGGRWGPDAIRVLHELANLQHNEDALDAILATMGGASGNVATSVLSDTWPVLKEVGYWMGSGELRDRVLVSDLNKLLKNVSSYNNTEKGWMAYQYGLQLSKDGRVIADGLDPWEGVFHSLTGLNKQETADSFLLYLSANEQQELETKVTKDAKRWVRLYLYAMQDGDQEAARQYSGYVRSLVIMGGFSEEKVADIVKQVQKEEPSIDIARKRFIEAPNNPVLKELREKALTPTQQEENN